MKKVFLCFVCVALVLSACAIPHQPPPEPLAQEYAVLQTQIPVESDEQELEPGYSPEPEPASVDAATTEDERIDIEDLIVGNDGLSFFDNMRYLFGEPSEQVPTERLPHRYYFNNGLRVDMYDVFMYYEAIHFIVADYTLTSGLTDFHFRGIDGTSTHDDMIATFGLPLQWHSGPYWHSVYHYGFARFIFNADYSLRTIHVFVPPAYSGTAAGLPVDIQHWLGQGGESLLFGEAQHLFGRLIGIGHHESPLYYYENGLIVSHLHIPYSPAPISSIIIDYGRADNRSAFHFNGIDGTSTYNDVVAMFGEPHMTRAGSDEERLGAVKSYGYWVLEDSRVVRFNFDEDYNVVAINFFIPHGPRHD